MEKLQSRVSVAESSVRELEERVREEEEEARRLRQDRDELREMNEKSSAELRKALEVERGGENERERYYSFFSLCQNLQDDQKAELETYVQSRAGLNDLYSATQRNLDTETKRRSHLEQELDLLKTTRAEKEVGRGLNLVILLEY